MDVYTLSSPINRIVLAGQVNLTYDFSFLVLGVQYDLGQQQGAAREHAVASRADLCFYLVMSCFHVHFIIPSLDKSANAEATRFL